MKRNFLSELLLYRYRYIIGYLIFAVVLIGALFISFQIPGQVTSSEQSSAVTSATLSLKDPSAKNVVDLPYHLLQKASLHFFDITNFGIKLPSLIIGALSAVGLLWLLRRWLLRDSIAIFTMCIFVAQQQFLATTQEGVALIMMMFWLIFVLLFALKFTANNKSLLWGVLLTSSLALSLYTPLTVYVVVCLLAASVLHPHLRYVVTTIPKLHILLFTVLAAILLSPLAIALVKNPLVLASLTGWPAVAVSFELIQHNFKEIFKAYIFFWQPRLSEVGLTPIFGASSFVLILLGILNLIRDHHSARSYMLLMTLPIVALPSLLNPDFLIILSVPLILLLGLGIETLLEEWYALFPHNPYARVTALVPMIVLLAGIMVGNLLFYINGYRYSPELKQYYTQDLQLSRQLLDKYPDATLVTTSKDSDFYDLLKRDFANLQVSQKTELSDESKYTISYIAPLAHTPKQLKEVAVDSYKDHGVRFYVYQK